MPYIKLRDGEQFERGFRRFVKSCEKAGLMAEIRKHQRYEKPSEARKRKSNAARRKMRRLMRIMAR